MASDAPTIVFVGVATYDAITVVPRYPHSDERIEATELVYGGGGPAATAAVAAHRQGANVILIAPVGPDDIGRRIAEDLTAESIDTSRLQVTPGRLSQGSVIVCAADEGSRAISTRAASPFTLTADNAELVRSAAWVHVDHLGWPAVEQALVGVSARDRPYLSVDAGNRLIGDDSLCDISRVDLYVPPLENLTGGDDDGTETEILERCPAVAVVATKGAGGSIGRDAGGSFFSAPGFTIDDFGSTLGAGDVFHGALVAAVAARVPLGAAITSANATAALSCRGVDGRSRIPGLDEIAAFLDTQLPTSKETAR